MRLSCLFGSDPGEKSCPISLHCCEFQSWTARHISLAHTRNIGMVRQADIRQMQSFLVQFPMVSAVHDLVQILIFSSMVYYGREEFVIIQRTRYRCNVPLNAWCQNRM
eukprot:Rmarinus@m.3707